MGWRETGSAQTLGAHAPREPIALPALRGSDGAIKLANMTTGTQAAMAEGSEKRKEPSDWVNSLAAALRDVHEVDTSSSEESEYGSDDDEDTDDYEEKMERDEERRRASRNPLILAIAAVLNERCPALVSPGSTAQIAAETLVDCGAEVVVFSPGAPTQAACPLRPPDFKSPKGRRRSLATVEPANVGVQAAREGLTEAEWSRAPGARRFSHRRSSTHTASSAQRLAEERVACPSLGVAAVP